MRSVVNSVCRLVRQLSSRVNQIHPSGLLSAALLQASGVSEQSIKPPDRRTWKLSSCCLRNVQKEAPTIFFTD